MAGVSCELAYTMLSDTETSSLVVEISINAMIVIHMVNFQIF